MVKKKFSNKWQGSKQPRKQRKYIHNAPLHLRRKMLSATLDKELRKKYERRSVEIRKGDEVFILNGEFKKRKGKVSVIDVGNSRVAIEGIQKTKRDGNKFHVWFNASNLKITSLVEDNKRFKKKVESKPKEEKKHAPKKN